MNSGNSRPTQADNPTFRVKLNVTKVIVHWSNRPMRRPIAEVRRWAQVLPYGSDAEALKALGLKP